ncbi:MAG: hypothetical protein LWX70_09200 [Sphingobacteriia bacterium]|nr:hypothetical protein [Sphingobacteriia bacterium]
MKRWVMVLWMVMALSLAMTAQEKVAYEQVVYLKNGSVVRGELLEQKDGQYIRLKTIDKGIVEISAADIRYSKTEELPANADYVLKNETLTPRFGGAVQLGFVFPSDFDGPLGGMASAETYYRVNNLIGLGAKLSLLRWDGNTSTPLEGLIRFDNFNDEAGPFGQITGGYSYYFPEGKFSITDMGFTFGAEAGFKSTMGNGLSLLYSVTYRYQEINQHFTSSSYNLLGLSIGLQF